MVRVGAILAYALFGISWLSWIIMLGGTAGMQAKCGGYLGHPVNIKLPGGADFQTFEEGCDTTNTTAFIWWTVWFEFFLLILLSVAECCRVPGLYLTKQLYLAMVSVCMMLAADRANVVVSTFEGALETSACVTLAGQCITIICNLIMMMYFGGEIAEMRRTSDADKAASMPVMSDQMGGNLYEREFARLVEAGAAPMVTPVAAPESKSAQRSSKAAAAALGAGTWQA